MATLADREAKREAQRGESSLIVAASEHLGHAGLAITAALYVHLGEVQRREAADAL